MSKKRQSKTPPLDLKNKNAYKEISLSKRQSSNRNQSRVQTTPKKELVFRWSLKMLFFAIFGIFLKILYTYSKKSFEKPDELSAELFSGKYNSTDATYQAMSEPLDMRQSIIGYCSSLQRMPTIFVGILVRNKAHTLPYFLHGIESQNYPKDRIQLVFVIDNSEDQSDDILNSWVNAVQDNYHQVHIKREGGVLLEDKMWTAEHHQHVMRLRQRLLADARKSWADFYLTIDADVIVLNQSTIRHLVEASLFPSKFNPDLKDSIAVIAPLFNCTSSEAYSNFWGAMNENGYYMRSDNYFDLQRRHMSGIYPVAMVHTVFMINLEHHATQRLAYDPPPSGYTGPTDDLIVFARSAQAAGVQFYLDNTQFYGFITTPVDEGDLASRENIMQQWLTREQELFEHMRLQAVVDTENEMQVIPSPHLHLIAESQLPVKDKLGFDEVYCINLDRRPDRRVKMEYFFDQLGIDAKFVSAVDGKLLTTDEIGNMGIVQLKGYADPYHKRSLKFGEIGCFLSHYYLWQEMIERGYETILILEDDVRFQPGFRRNLKKAMNEANLYVPNWELLYIGRKRMSKDEKRVRDTELLAHPDYTYWTLGYVLKKRGAEKLLAQQPLRKMVAVDEYLPIMFNRHPRQEWLSQFEPRNLVAISTEPLLIEPQRYTGEINYTSDTEDSTVFNT